MEGVIRPTLGHTTRLLPETYANRHDENARAKPVRCHVSAYAITSGAGSQEARSGGIGGSDAERSWTVWPASAKLIGHDP